LQKSELVQVANRLAYGRCSQTGGVLLLLCPFLQDATVHSLIVSEATCKYLESNPKREYIMNRTLALATTLTLLCGSISVAATAEIQLKPVPRTAQLRDPGYIVWGASMVQDDDGTCHLFYCRWKGKLQRDWYMRSEIVHATAKNPQGPYERKEVVLTKRPEGADAWDGFASYNPTVVRFGDKYYLYYTGCNGSNRRTRLEDGTYKSSPNGTILAQRIGVAVADHPAGPWKRMDGPLLDLSEEGFDTQMVCNPTVTQGGDGRFMMIYKCSNGSPKQGGGIYLSVAFSDSPTGPFKKSGQKILSHPDSNFAVEDPFLWWQDGKYRCVVDDQHGDFSGAKGLILFESEDGLDWQKSDPFVLSRCQIEWEDDEIGKTHHFERPQIWLKDGKPAMLFVAIAQEGEHFNLHVPLQ
jgi:predicted GH43/DUF377 family glycosyl hydrolase